MFRFADPYYLFLVLPLGLAAWFVYRRRQRSGMLFSTFRIPATSHTFRIMAANVLPGLFLAGLFLTTLALARPQTVFSRIRNKTDAIAIEMVVDVSGTMEALDLSVRTGSEITKLRTRLDAAKVTFAQFVDKRPDDLIGLITFGGYATTRVPLTADHDALLHVLQGVVIPKVSFDSQGQVVDQEELLTAIGDALATACTRLQHCDLKSRIAILLSDGESNTGIIKPEEAIKIAKKMGIKIYTIGIGSKEPAPFLRKDMFGKDVIVRGNVELDEQLLGTIAKTTGGRYFNVRDPAGLDRAMEEINKLEKTRIERNIYEQYNELFLWFLVPALCLVAAGTGFNMMIAKRLL